MNSDGKPDIVVANKGSNTIGVLLGNGNGTFQAQQTLATGTAPDSVAVGDVNGDGKPDLVVANLGSNTVSVLLNSANGDFTGQTYTIVSPAAVTQFLVSPAPTSITSGGSVTITVTAETSLAKPPMPTPALFTSRRRTRA